jgi:phosphohistidine phosphatase
MRLYLVRHAMAEAVSPTGRDADRTLTDEGRERMRGAADGLRALGIQLDRVFTSPFLRAGETAAILAAALGDVGTEVLDELAAGAVPATVLRAVRRHRHLEAVALVGHQPDLGSLASQLMTGTPDACPLPFKKGAIACFQVSITRGQMRGLPEWFMTTKQLRAIGER